MNQLLRIGDFARLGRVSVKTLRFYELEGLLKPDYVDPATSYRYYGITQTASLSQITNLRAAGFHISEISALLQSDQTAKTMAGYLSAQRENLLKDIDAILEQVRIIDALSTSVVNNGAEGLSTVKLTSVSPQRVYSVSKRVPSLGAPVTEIFETAEAEVAASNARLDCAPFLIFHDPPTQRIDLEVEVCIPVTEESRGCIHSTIVPGCKLACAAVYRGQYEQTESLRNRIGAWIDSVGMRPSGPLREIYHRFGADQEDYKLPANMLAKRSGENLTEIILPLEPS